MTKTPESLVRSSAARRKSLDRMLRAVKRCRVTLLTRAGEVRH